MLKKLPRHSACSRTTAVLLVALASQRASGATHADGTTSEPNGSRRAVIFVGGGRGDLLSECFERTARLAKAAMLKRGFDEEGVRMFRIARRNGQTRLREGAGDPLEEALLWLGRDASRIEEVFIYVVAHGRRSTDGQLIVEGKGKANISARSLGEFVVRIGKMATPARIVVFVSCCYSGLFVPIRSTEGTTVITSTAADQEGWASQSGTVFFDTQFFSRWGEGEPVAEAFAGAVETCSFLGQTPGLRLPAAEAERSGRPLE